MERRAAATGRTAGSRSRSWSNRNPVRLHSALGYRSPVRYEQEMRADP